MRVAAELSQVRTICALNARAGLLELVRHEFPEGSFRRQRFTSADGTVVTIDLGARTWDVTPKLDIPDVIR